MKRDVRVTIAATLLAIALAPCLTGCSMLQNTQPSVRVAPENLDFDYTVQDASNSALRVMSDGTQTLVVLRDPLPTEMTFVPVKVADQLLRATVRGNTVGVSGVPQAFSVLLPAGLVNVTRVSNGPDSMPSDPIRQAAQVNSTELPAVSADADVGPDTNWDWEGSGTVGRGAHSAAPPQLVWGLPKTLQTIPGGPLPGAMPANAPPDMPSSIDDNDNAK